jgi:hypothetical protein
MRPGAITTIIILILLGSFMQVAAQVDPALRLRVRDLDERGVVGISFVLRDGRDQAQTVQTGTDGSAVVAGLVGASVRIVEARSAGGQRLVMDENDPAGGLRIPLLSDGEQVINFRLTDNLLFVEPAAVTEGPIPTELAQMAPPDEAATPTPMAMTTTPLPVVPAPTTPTRQGWSRWWYAAWALPLLPLAIGWLQSRSARRPR